jgi:tetratricopeptide (TPR) repeat protein
MSKRSRLLLVAACVLLLVLGVASWFGIQTARSRQQLAAALATLQQAAAAGRAGAAACERVLPAVERQLPLAEASAPDADAQKKLYRAIGECRMQLGRYAHAAEAYERAVFLDPQSARAHADLALALSRAGKHQSALQHARLSVQLAPGTWQAHRALGRVLERGGHLVEAAAAMEQARSLAPPDQQTAAQRAIERIQAKARGTAPSGPDED